MANLLKGKLIKGSIINQHIQETMRLISGSASDYIKSAAPTISEVGEGVSDAARYIKNIPNSEIVTKMRFLNTQQVFRKTRSWFSNSKDELEANQTDISLDIQTDDDESPSPELVELEKENKVAMATIGAAEQLADVQMGSTANIVSKMDRMESTLVSQLTAINQNMADMLSMLTTNTSRMIEMQAADLTLQSDKSDKFGSSQFKLSEWKKSIKNNLKDLDINGIPVGMFASLFDLGKSMGKQDIVSMVFESIVDKAFPNLKNGINELDDAVNDMIMGSLARLGENAKNANNPLLSALGKIFGINVSRENLNTDVSKLELKQTPFDTVTKEAITQTIPGYLKEIVTLLGGKEKVYDYKNRKFRAADAFEDDFREASVELLKSNMYSGISGKKISRSVTGDKKRQQLIDQIIFNRLSEMDPSAAREWISQMDSKSIDELIKKYSASFHDSSGNASVDLRKVSKQYELLTGDERLNMWNNIVRYNTSRNRNLDQFLKEQQSYGNISGMGFSDSAQKDLEYILRQSGEKKATSSISSNAFLEETESEDMTYSNNILYDIFRRLDKGINTFIVGQDLDIRTKPFKKFSHIKPPQRIVTGTRSNDDDLDNGVSPMRDTDSKGNERDNYRSLKEELEDESEIDPETGEPISKGKRVGKWAKNSASNFGHAILSGKPGDVRKAFFRTVGDVGTVAKEASIAGIKKLNDSFGNVGGYVKHFFTGAPYEYYDVDPETGKRIRYKVPRSKGGLIGYIGDKILGTKGEDGHRTGGLWGKAKDVGNNAWKKIHETFGSKDDTADVITKRRKFISTAVGAVMGGNILGGIIGGPLGMLVGGLAGSAFSASNFGKRLKTFIFGEKDEDGEVVKKGLIQKLFSATGYIGKAIQNWIVKPIIGLGKGIINAGKGIGKFIISPFVKLGTTITRGFNWLLFGNREMVLNPKTGEYEPTGPRTGGLLRNFFNATFGNIFKQIGSTLNQAKDTVVKKILDPISDTLFAMKETVKNKASDFLLGREDKDGNRHGGIFSPLINGTHKAKDFVSNKIKNFFNKSFDLLGTGLKTILSSPFVAARFLMSMFGGQGDEFAEDSKKSWNKNVKNAKGFDKVRGFGKWFSNLGTKRSNLESDGGFADDIAEGDDRVAEALRKRREKRNKDRYRFSQEHMDDMYEDFMSYFKRNEEIQAEVVDEQQEVNENTAKVAEDVSVLREEGTKKGSIFTHDHTVVSRIEEIIEILKDRNFSNNDEGGNSSFDSYGSAGGIGIFGDSFNDDDGKKKSPEKSSSVNKAENKSKSITEKKSKDDKAFASGLLTSASAIATEGAVTDEDVNIMGEMQEEASKDKPNRSRMNTLYKKILRQNNDVEEGSGSGKKEEDGGFLSKLLGGLGGVGSFLGNLFSFITSPLGIATAGLLIYALNGGDVAGLLGGIINTIGNVASFLIKPQEEGSMGWAIQDAVGKQGGNLVGGGSAMMSAGNKAITSGLDDIAKAGGPTGGIIGKIIDRIPILNKIIPTTKSVNAAAKSSGGLGAKIANGIGDSWKSQAGKVLDDVADTAHKAADATKKTGVVSKIIDAGSDFLSKHPKLKGFVDAVKKFFNWISNGLKSLKVDKVMKNVDDMVGSANAQMKGISNSQFLTKAKGMGKINWGNIIKKAGKALAIVGVCLEVYSAALRYAQNSDDPQLQEYANTMMNGGLLDKICALFNSLIYMVMSGKEGIDGIMDIAYNATLTIALDVLTPVGIVKLIVGLCELLFTWLGNLIGGDAGKALIGLATGCSDLLNFAVDLVAAGANLVEFTNGALPQLINALATGDWSWFSNKLSSLWSNLRSSGGNLVGSLTKIVGDTGVGLGQGFTNIGMRIWQGLGNAWNWITGGDNDKWNADMNKSIDDVNASFSGAYDAVNNTADEWNNAIAGRGRSKNSTRIYGSTVNNVFSQNNPRYKTLGMDDNGCGPVALSLAMSKDGIYADPAKVDMYMTSQGLLDEDGATTDDMQTAASSLGYDMESSNNNKEKFVRELANGKPAVMLGHGKQYDTSSGEYHYMTASGIDKDGNVTVTNPFTGMESKSPIDSLLAGTENILYPKKGKGERDSSNTDQTNETQLSDATTPGQVISGAFTILKETVAKIGKYLFGDLFSSLSNDGSNSNYKQERGESDPSYGQDVPSDQVKFPLNGESSIAPSDWEGLPDWNPDIAKGVSGSWEKRAEYARYIAPLMQKDFEEHHILPSFNIAQSIIEGLDTSGTGKNVPEGSILTDASTNYRNIFGIDNGVVANQHVPFNNWKDNVYEHGALLNRKQGYNSIVGEKNIDNAINKFDFGLYQWGRGGVKNNWYIDLMKQMVSKLNLTQYDQNLNWEMTPEEEEMSAGQQQEMEAMKSTGDSTASSVGIGAVNAATAGMAAARSSGRSSGSFSGKGRKGKGRKGRGGTPGETLSQAFGILKETASKLTNYLLGGEMLDDGSVLEENYKPGENTESESSESGSQPIQTDSKYPSAIQGSDAKYLTEVLGVGINHDYMDRSYHKNGHLGVDYPVGMGTKIPTTASGTVVAAKYRSGGWGNQVIVKANSDDTIHTFNHLSNFAVSPGQQVKRGEVIGYSGSTGNSTGPHLDYTIAKPESWNGSTLSVSGRTINPHNISHAEQSTMEEDAKSSKNNGMTAGSNAVAAGVAAAMPKGRGPSINNTFRNKSSSNVDSNSIGGSNQILNNISTEKMEVLLSGILQVAEAIKKNTTPSKNPKGGGSSEEYSSPVQSNRGAYVHRGNAALPYNQTNVNSIMSLVRGTF